MTAANPPSPLAGMVVLDLTQIMAGPVCTMLLADLGADVIKIEKPAGGDDTRRMGPPLAEGWAAGFLALNRNKRSLALNLRDDRGPAVFRRLLAGADVVVENFRPGVMARLGLDYAQLAQLKPSLVYCAISGFGGSGPYARRGGFDLVAQGMSGLMSITGFPDSPPAKVGVPITDISAGSLAAYGILCAYIHTLKTGQGQIVDTSLLEAGIAYTIWESALYFSSGEIPGPLGSAHRVSAPYQALRTADGYINIGAATQGTWEQFCRAIGQDALIEDTRFKAPADRKARGAGTGGAAGSCLVSTNHRLLAGTTGASRGSGRADLQYGTGLSRPRRYRPGEMVVDLEDPELGRLRHIGIPVKLSTTPGQIRRRAPALGEHSREVLREAGLCRRGNSGIGPGRGNPLARLKWEPSFPRKRESRKATAFGFPLTREGR